MMEENERDLFETSSCENEEHDDDWLSELLQDLVKEKNHAHL